MIGSVRVDIVQLYRLSNSLGVCANALQLNDQRPDAGQVGNGDVYNALDHFFNNWNYKRTDLHDKLQKLSTGIANAATTYQQQETSLASAFDPGASNARASVTLPATALSGLAVAVGLAGRNWKDMLGVAKSTKFAIGLAKNAKVLSNTEANAKHLFAYSKTATSFHALPFAGTLSKATRAVGVAASAVGVGVSSFGLGTDIAKGHYGDVTRKGIDVAWTIGGVAAPPVGMAKAAWDGGFLIGEGAAWGQERVFHTQQRTVDYAVETYGTKDIGTRYNGWSGFGNFALDAVHIKNPFGRHK